MAAGIGALGLATTDPRCHWYAWTDMAIRMYSTQWCSDCWRAKNFLREQGIEFTEIDIENDDSAAALVMRKNDGKRRVPTFDIDGAFYGNPNIPELARILGVAI